MSVKPSSSCPNLCSNTFKECSPSTLRKFLTEIPKTDLHVHLDGSVRLSTLIELAQTASPPVYLPSYDEFELRNTIFKTEYVNLAEYLEGFKYIAQVLQTPENLERVAYEFAQDNFNEGVYYFEVRFAPQLHCSADKTFDIKNVLLAVNRGLLRAKNEFNQKKTSATNKNILYDYGIIVCAMRFFTPSFSQYYNALSDIHPFSTMEELSSLASVSLVRAAIASRDVDGLPIVALDVAGSEHGNEAETYKSAFAIADKYFLSKTVHAGEAFGPESILQAIRDLHAERIGHGYHIFSHDLVTSHSTLDIYGSAENFISQLSDFIAHKQITLEICLTSNLNTMPNLARKGLSSHPFKKMLDSKISVTLNTDNRLISNTSIVNELEKAIKAFNLKPKQLKEIVISGFEKAFRRHDQTYIEKCAYIDKVTQYYDDIALKYKYL